MNIYAPKSPRRFRLRFDVYFPSQVLQVARCFCHCHLCLPCCWKNVVSRVPLLHERYLASSLLHTRPPPAHLRLTSWFASYKVYLAPEAFSLGRDGLLQLLIRALITMPPLPPRRSDVVVSVRFQLHMLSSLYGCKLDLRGYALSRPPMCLLSLQPGNSPLSFR